ncbi:MAG: cellulosome anchor protein, partial [Bacteroidota bacterium]
MNRACCRLAALFLIGLAVFAPIAAGDGSTVMVQNEAIRLVVNDTDDGRGRFAVDVTGGDPARVEDNGQPLIYGRPIPWTSYTTVRIDGVSYAFGGPTTRRAGKDLPTGEATTLPVVKDGAIISAWRYGEIEVTQHLSIVDGPTTGALDTARIAYTITNRGQERHRVGLRICLDTMLGENDGAPLRMGARQIETDEALSGAQIQPYWQAFDSLSEPKVIA